MFLLLTIFSVFVVFISESVVSLVYKIRTKELGVSAVESEDLGELSSEELEEVIDRLRELLMILFAPKRWPWSDCLYRLRGRRLIQRDRVDSRVLCEFVL